MSARGDRYDTYSSGFSEVTRVFRVAGGWGNVAGPGFFMFRVVSSGTVSSVVWGLSGASIGAAVFGTAALPFLLSACAGFMFGAIGFYRYGLAQAKIMLDRYPRLLQLHLDANFPAKEFRTWRREQLSAAVFSKSWVLQSMLLCAWLTAQPALDQIAENREQVLVEEARTEIIAATKNPDTDPKNYW